jgi:hypothetical protein
LQNDCASQWAFISSKDSSAEKYLPRVSFDLHSCPSWFKDREDGSSQGIQKFMIPKLTDYENDLFNKKLSLYFIIQLILFEISNVI